MAFFIFYDFCNFYVFHLILLHKTLLEVVCVKTKKNVILNIILIHFWISHRISYRAVIQQKSLLSSFYIEPHYGRCNISDDHFKPNFSSCENPIMSILNVILIHFEKALKDQVQSLHRREVIIVQFYVEPRALQQAY